MSRMTYAPWVVLHVPHDAALVPEDVRGQFTVGEEELHRELCMLTDHHTHELFVGDHPEHLVIRSPVSRLVVDVERFEDDALEVMAERGLGVLYRCTSRLTPLRRDISSEERENLLRRYYRPHHAALERAVADVLAEFGRCLVLDCHSFPSTPLPYEAAKPDAPRPDICVGTDGFHTSLRVCEAFENAFRKQGWSVCRDEPFAGALVPASRYQKDSRVQGLMVEVNRKLYLEEPGPSKHVDFDACGVRVRAAVRQAIGGL
jgi:N-formylglutamate deformylase